MFFPWAKRLDRDRFTLVRSDGKRWVAAIGAQPNDNNPHDPYLYVVDGSKGTLQYVAPSVTRHQYCVGSKYVVLVSDPKGGEGGRQDIEVRSVSDAAVIHKAAVSDYLSDGAFSVAIAEDVVRLTGPDGRGEAFLELPSGKGLDRDEAARIVHGLVEKGILDKDDPWNVASHVRRLTPSTRPVVYPDDGQKSARDALQFDWENNLDFPKQAKCGDLTIRIKINEQTSLVATRD